jgi:hypothetical protein
MSENENLEDYEKFALAWSAMRNMFKSFMVISLISIMWGLFVEFTFPVVIVAVVSNTIAFMFRLWAQAYFDNHPIEVAKLIEMEIEEKQ